MLACVTCKVSEYLARPRAVSKICVFGENALVTHAETTHTHRINLSELRGEREWKVEKERSEGKGEVMGGEVCFDTAGLGGISVHSCLHMVF